MFIFKGISTKDMKIIVEEPENLIAKAPLKHEVLNIEGRDDAIYHPLGYAPVEIPLTLQLLDPSKIDQVLMWLNGEGELVYKNRKTKARIFSEIQPIRTAGIRIINIEIIRAPFWYDLEDDYSEAWGANLIPNGWNSFVPYGNEGEETKAPLEVFNKDYTKNLVKNSKFQKGIKGWDLINHASYNTEDGLTISSRSSYILIGQRNILFTKGNVYYLRFKATVRNKSIIRWYAHKDMGALAPYGTYNNKIVSDRVIGDKGLEFRINFYDSNESSMGINSNMSDFMVVNLTEHFGEGKEPTKEWCDENIGQYLHWDDISEEDKPVRAWDNMYVVITPLENSLTRVQTKGGNHSIKLLYGIGTGHKGIYTLSMYGRPRNNNHNARLYFQGVGKGVKVDSDSFITIAGEINPNIGAQARIMVDNPSESTDFVASTPAIVEGDTPPTWEADENPRIVNEGTAPSKPLIRLTKGTSSTCEFEVNGVYFKYHFNHDTEVLIDCEKMEASDNGQLRNRHLTIGYEFPVLEPGPNVVKRISGDAKIEFKRKDRWL